MTRREVSDRYAGQVLGTFWAIGHPLALMAIYVFIFGYVVPHEDRRHARTCRWITRPTSLPD